MCVVGAGLAGAGTGPSTVPVGASAVAYHNITSGDGEMNGLSVTLALCLRHGAPVTLYKPLSVVKAPPPPPRVAHLTPFVFFFVFVGITQALPGCVFPLVWAGGASKSVAVPIGLHQPKIDVPGMVSSRNDCILSWWCVRDLLGGIQRLSLRLLCCCSLCSRR